MSWPHHTQSQHHPLPWIPEEWERSWTSAFLKAMEGESHCSFFNTPQAVVSAQAWGEKKEKEKENRKGIFSRNLLAPEGRICRITWPNTLHCDPGTPFSSPASHAYQRVKSTLCLAHRFAHKVKRKCQLRSRCPAPQQEAEELLSWLCWTTCQ